MNTPGKKKSPWLAFCKVEGICYQYNRHPCPRVVQEGRCDFGNHICYWCYANNSTKEPHPSTGDDCPQITTSYKRKRDDILESLEKERVEQEAMEEKERVEREAMEKGKLEKQEREKEEKIKCMTAWMKLLHHTSRCMQRDRTYLLLVDNAKCAMTNCDYENCSKMKGVLRHVEKCSGDCDNSHCDATKSVISHWKQCTAEQCTICLPVKEASNHENQVLYADNLRLVKHANNQAKEIEHLKMLLRKEKNQEMPITKHNFF